MEVTEKNNDRSTWRTFLKFIRQHRVLKWTVSLLLFIILFTSIGISGIYWGTKLKYSSYSSFFASFQRYFEPSLNTVVNYVKGQFSSPNVVRIDIKHMDLQKLAYQVEKARKRGEITKEEKAVSVNAVLEYNNTKYKTKLKLRGTYLDHLRGDKWSFRVQMRGNNTLFGMSRFSLMNPETRAHIHEWIFQKILRYEGLISLRYDFVKLILNGKNLGIYAIEEFFDKYLIENNQRREGLIVKPFYEVPFVYREKKVLKTPTLKQSYELLKDFLAAYNQGKLPADRIFDIEKTAKVFALAELFGGQHGHLSPNFVCYFNPVTTKLERIGYDTNVSRSIERYKGMITSPRAEYRVKKHAFFRYLFNNNKFYTKYIEELERVTEPNYISNFLSTIESELKDKLAILYKEYPYFNYFRSEFLLKNAEYIRDQLIKKGNINSNFIAYNNFNNVNVLVDNLRDLSIQIIGLEIDNKIVFRPKERSIIKPTLTGEPNIVRLYKGSKDIQANYLNNAKIVYKIYGIDQLHKVDLNNIPSNFTTGLHAISKVFSSDFVSKKSNIKEFPFIKIDNELKRIFIPMGKYTLNRDLIIPSGYTFELEKGVELNIINFLSILSYSPLRFIGSLDRPIKIHSSDGTGQGILVINAKQKSFLKNVTFNRLSALSKSGWALTGAVTFYQSDVDLKGVECSGNINSDDCINIIRSKFNISNTIFKNTFSDALDVDFGNGNISNSTFINIGGDAVDGSGSNITIKKSTATNIIDKAFSCGEKSSFKIEKVDISNANISFASKDDSHINVKDINISDSVIGFVVFQKKPEFGPSHIDAKNIRFNNIKEKFIIEDGSTLSFDSKKIEPSNKNVKSLIYAKQ